MESKGSPLSDAKKREWEGATDFSKLPDKVSRETSPIAPKPVGALTALARKRNKGLNG